MSTKPFNMPSLPHRVNLQRRTVAVDAVMSRVETWINVRTRIKCRIIPIKAKERVWMKREGESITHMMHARVEPRFSYRTTDRITWGSRTLEIIGVVNEQEVDAMYEISLQEIL